MTVTRSARSPTTTATPVSAAIADVFDEGLVEESRAYHHRPE
ncbi:MULTISPECIES: hypothetical protein [Nocardia]|nr:MULTISPECIES: hypothetical protein [Nocardia]